MFDLNNAFDRAQQEMSITTSHGHTTFQNNLTTCKPEEYLPVLTAND